MIQLKLTRALRKSIRQGHPWIYKEAFAIDKKSLNKVSQISDVAQISDSKGKISIGIYDSTSALGFRCLDFNPFNKTSLGHWLDRAISLRKVFLEKEGSTSAFRLINGEGDGFPGCVCDVYDKVAVLQFDGKGMEHFWSQVELSEEIEKKISRVETVCFKPRDTAKELKLLKGQPLESMNIDFKENGLFFGTELNKAQKTGFFLDQRENREYLKSFCRDKDLINLFSYTGGFSVYAGAGGARSVTSVDISQGALDQAHENWKKNSLPEKNHKTLCTDAYEFLSQSKEKMDSLVVDPPSMTSSKETKGAALAKYTELFTHACRSMNTAGDLFLSSCSSQISFVDFEYLVGQALSEARRKAQVLHFSGQGFDHPYPHACPEMRYLKFMHLKIQ